MSIAAAVALALTLGATPMMNDLTFLTGEGCVNTPEMVNNLDDVLIAMKLRRDYQFIDIGKLPKGDPRTGYPTPTILWKGKDLFGMPVRSRPMMCQVDAPTRAEFRPSQRFRDG